MLNLALVYDYVYGVVFCGCFFSIYALVYNACSGKLLPEGNNGKVGAPSHFSCSLIIFSGSSRRRGKQKKEEEAGEKI